MSNGVTTVDKSKVKTFLKSEAVQKSIKDTLGQKASQFTASLLSLVGSDELLAQAEPNSLFSAALTAASLDLPINKNLGFAHIIGYKNNRKGGVVEAQFQIGYKGFIQLAQRTGQYKKINATAVYEGQLIEEDPLAGNTYDWQAKKSDDVIGYVSRFTLVTGFESELYMSNDEIKAHAKRYSQAYKSGYGPWADNFDAMALKTVIKLNLSKYGPQSTELQKAMVFDQGVVKGEEAEYPDGVDLDSVGADDDKKQAIIAANADQAQPVEVDKETETVTTERVHEVFGKAPVDEQPPKESVADKAKRRYGPKTPAKQASLTDSDNG